MIIVSRRNQGAEPDHARPAFRQYPHGDVRDRGSFHDIREWLAAYPNNDNLFYGKTKEQAVRIAVLYALGRQCVGVPDELAPPASTSKRFALPIDIMIAGLADTSPVLFAPSPQAAERFIEFFTENIRNPNTRRAYLRAVTDFATWLEEWVVGIALECIASIHVAAYVEQLQDRLSAPSVKQHLAAIRCSSLSPTCFARPLPKLGDLE